MLQGVYGVVYARVRVRVCMCAYARGVLGLHGVGGKT